MDLHTPEGITADVQTTDGSGQKQQIHESGIVSVGTGTVQIRANRVRTTDSLIGNVYAPDPANQTLCVFDGDQEENRIDYTLDERGHRLYVLGASSVLGIQADELMNTGSISVEATFTGGLTSLQDAAFDRLGRLWVVDAGAIHAYTDPTVGGQTPDITLTGPEIDNGSVPGPASIAFSQEDLMFVAHQAGNYIAVYSEDQTLATADIQAKLTIDSVPSPRDLAFDSNGNLWVVTGDSTIQMYAAERLLPNEAGEYSPIQGADLQVTAAYDGQVSGQFRDPSSIAFDDQGILWVGWFANNALTPLVPSELEDGAEVIPEIILTLPVDVLLEDLAFDEDGGLWYTSAAHKIARIAPEDLAMSTDWNGETLQPETLDYAGGLVFYPAPTWSPIAF